MGFTSVDNILIMQVVNGFENLSDSLRGVFFCESTLFTNPVKEFSASGQLRYDVVLVLLCTDRLVVFKV
jgi:hypothetical protein